LGGTLTNFDTVRASIRRLDEIEKNMSTPEYMRQSKKAQARDGRERRRILRNLEGVRNMTKLPDAMFVVDPAKEMSAVREAHRLNIPLIGLVDSDTDPELVNLPIPGNDDGIRAIQSVIKVVLDGLAKGRADQVTKIEPASAPA
jgi:small subunit ribosomal protein S2